MAQGNEIVVSAGGNGRETEGILSGVIYPGTCLEMTSAEPVGGRYTWRVYQPGTDGEQRVVAVLDMDKAGGRLATTAYASVDQAKIYFPCPGEELNMRVADVGGTGDNHVIGGVYTVDSGTGLQIKTTSTPEMEPFVNLETHAALTADTLLHMLYTGK
jgi:hypothetical protein